MNVTPTNIHYAKLKAVFIPRLFVLENTPFHMSMVSRRGAHYKIFKSSHSDLNKKTYLGHLYAKNRSGGFRWHQGTGEVGAKVAPSVKPMAR